MRFGVGLFADRAAKAAEAIAMCSEALAFAPALGANHYLFGFGCILQISIIQLALAVCKKLIEETEGLGIPRRPSRLYKIWLFGLYWYVEDDHGFSDSQSDDDPSLDPLDAYFHSGSFPARYRLSGSGLYCFNCLASSRLPTGGSRFLIRLMSQLFPEVRWHLHGPNHGIFTASLWHLSNNHLTSQQLRENFLIC